MAFNRRFPGCILLIGYILLFIPLLVAGCSQSEAGPVVEQLQEVKLLQETEVTEQDGDDPVTAETEAEKTMLFSGSISTNTTVRQILALPEFEGFGRLLFPVDRPASESSTLQNLATDGTYVWYSNLRADVFASALNKLKAEADAGEQIFYPIYSESEIVQDPTKADTGLFFFRGGPGAPFAIVNAGGGFAYVAALHDSFPQADEISEARLNAFALIYRPDDPYADLARAITFICDHAVELGVLREGYSLWGGSAGARMAATLGNQEYLRQLTGRSDIPQAAAIVMQYTGFSATSPYDAPAYINVGTNDGIANWRTMRSRADALTQRYGIPTQFYVYEGLSHGFGTGKGTVAEGWVDDAIAFWRNNTK